MIKSWWLRYNLFPPLSINPVPAPCSAILDWGPWERWLVAAQANQLCVADGLRDGLVCLVQFGAGFLAAERASGG
jgi:hypothetical protein